MATKWHSAYLVNDDSGDDWNGTMYVLIDYTTGDVLAQHKQASDAVKYALGLRYDPAMLYARTGKGMAVSYKPVKYGYGMGESLA